MMPRMRLALVVLGMLFAACSSGSTKGESERPKGPPAPWETMTWEARKAYMEAEVLPHMRPLFQAYDPAFFAQVDCTTCHGIDAEEQRFKMPNEDILALYPTGHPKQEELVRRQPKMLRFMFGTVVPEMTALLNAPAYDPETKQGFSCFSCHPRGSD